MGISCPFDADFVACTRVCFTIRYKDINTCGCAEHRAIYD